MEIGIMDNAKLRKFALSMVIGGVAGFAVAFTFMRVVDTGVIGDLEESRVIAALVGALYVMTATFVGIGLINPQVGAKFLNVEDADELREQMVVLRYSMVSIIALGAILILLALAAPAGPLAEPVVACLIALLLVITVFTTRKQMAHIDELMASVSRETSALAFYLVALIGGGWAAAAHLGFVGGPAMLDWITLIATITLVATFWVCGRRGLLTPR